MMIITESIEMELFSSEESCVVIQTVGEEQQMEKYTSNQRNHKHPLVVEDEDEGGPELPVQTQTSPDGTNAEKEPPNHKELKLCSPGSGKTKEMEIEMQMFPFHRVTEKKSAKLSNKAASLRWKRVTQNAGLVVKDVICLPSGYLAHLDRQSVSHVKPTASPTVTARITIDSDWTATQMHSCLVLFFSRCFIQPAGHRLSFTFLQRVQGSSVVFVPEAPAQGWTGRQVLSICEHGPLYVLSHLDYTQAEPEKLLRNRRFCVNSITACCLDEVRQQTGEQVTLDALLRLYRQENTHPDEEIHICLQRAELLHGALEAVARPDFCFRKTPVVSFRGEEPDGNQPIGEFFRLVMKGLQESPLFEGRPGRLLLTYDLAALERRMYYKAGVLIGWSLAHGGPGPRCLHPVLFQLMCSQNPSLEDFSWDDIISPEVQRRLQQLRSCTDVSSLSPSLRDWLLSCGISGICLEQSEEISAIYSSAVKHYIYHRVASMIFQLKDGLNSCGGLWDVMESRWEMFVAVMSSVPQQPLTRPELQQLFSVCYSQSEGSLRTAEEATVQHWETALEELRGGRADFSLEELLTFITGAARLPPLGLPTLISLRFYSQDERESRVRLPYASEHPMELYLPRGVAAPADLLMLLSRAVHGARGSC